MAKIALSTLTGSVFEEELGIAILASQLRNIGYEVDIHHFYDKNKMVDSLCMQKYDALCFNAYHVNIDVIADVSTQIKASNYIPIAVGGHFAKDNYDIILSEYDCFDYVMIGEAEEIICDLMKYIVEGQGVLSEIEGIAYKKRGNVVCNNKRIPVMDLDRIPFASRDIAKIYKLKSVYVEGSRGCSGTCTFCSNNCVPYREKSIVRIVDEIEYVMKDTSINVFSFTDCSWDNPNNNLDRITELCRIVNEKEIAAHYFLFFKSPIVRITDDKFWDMLTDVGVFSVFIGLESFVEEELHLFSKKCTVNDNIRAMEMLTQHKHHLHTQVGIIFFQPYSTIENMKINNFYMHKFGKALQFQQCNSLEIYNHTPMHQKLLKDGLFRPKHFNFTDYEFLDERVRSLFQFVNENLIHSEINRKIFSMNSYFRNHYSYLVIQMRNYIRAHNDAGKEVVQAHLDKMFAIAAQVNDISFMVFDELLDVAKCGWDEGEAKNIIRTYLSEQTLSSIVSIAQSNRKTLLKGMTEIKNKRR